MGVYDYDVALGYGWTVNTLVVVMVDIWMAYMRTVVYSLMGVLGCTCIQDERKMGYGYNTE